MDLEFETVSCALCGSDRQAICLSGRDRLTGMAGEFQFVRCLDCGLIRQSPRLTPVSLAQYYPAEYPLFQFSQAARQSALRRLDYRLGQLKRVRLVQRFRHSGDLLDVGCGTGDFVYEMSRCQGWRARGLEPSPYACHYAREILRLDVVCAELDNHPFAERDFDLVTMWNVLEHLYDPGHALQCVHRLLRPGGLLILAVPVVPSFLSRLFGPYWSEWDLPRHLYIFARQTMERLCREAGFTVKATGSIASEYRVLRMSLFNWGQSRVSPTLLQSVLAFLPIRLLGAAACRIAVPPQHESVQVFVCEQVP